LEWPQRNAKEHEAKGMHGLGGPENLIVKVRLNCGKSHPIFFSMIFARFCGLIQPPDF